MNIIFFVYMATRLSWCSWTLICDLDLFNLCKIYFLVHIFIRDLVNIWCESPCTGESQRQEPHSCPHAEDAVMTRWTLLSQAHSHIPKLKGIECQISPTTALMDSCWCLDEAITELSKFLLTDFSRKFHLLIKY